MPGGNATIHNTIIATNTASAFAQGYDVYGTLQSTSAHNLIGINTGFGETGTFGKSYMQWYSNKTDLESLGYNVVIFDNDAFAKTVEKIAMWAFVSTINTHSSSKHLHGMYMMGHGSTYDIGSKGWLGSLQNYTVVGPIWAMNYGKVKDGTNIQSGIQGEEKTWTIGNALTYHLGAIIIQACESNESSARGLKSTGGIFHGETGTYFPVAYDIASNWGESYRFVPLVGVEWTYGGQQNTVPFTKLKSL